MTFNEKYSKIKELGRAELTVIEQKMVSSINTKEPLNSYLKDFLSLPSKRVRPLLAILYVKAQGKNLTEKQLELLSIIELIHNASLIHDDVIDKSNLRRGHKTISAEFDNKLAVISGDYILSVVMENLTELDNIEIIKNLSNTIKQMCLGEINQNFDRYKIGTIEDYIEKTKDKTARLFESTLICCNLAGEGSIDFDIENFGLDVGTAFQIRDDLRNLINEDNEKPLNSDISEGIYNAPVIFARNIEDYTSGIEKTKDLLNNYIKSAEKRIENLPENIYKTALVNFLELLNNV